MPPKIEHGTPDNIKAVRAEYNDHAKTWQQIQDCTAGEQEIKEKGDLYLPFPVPHDDEIKKTKEYQQEYDIYLDGAHFSDYTSQAVEDLIAGIYRVDPIVENLPADLEYLTLPDFSRKAAAAVTTYGRGFALCDYPITDAQPDKASEEQLGLYAFFRTYAALDILNWDEVQRGGINTISRVVLREKFKGSTEADEESRVRTRYRELLLVEGVYTVRLYDEDGILQGGDITPKANGSTLDHIPGTFLGVTTNDSTIDKPPVKGIAATNIKHYQTWGELSHVQTYMGHPTLAVTGAPDGFVKKMKDNNIRISVGASKALVFEGDKAKADILQINGTNIIHFKTLEQLERSMADQGARLRSQNNGGGAETAEAIKLRSASDISVMASIATQVERAVVTLIGFAAEFMACTVPENFSFTLNKDFIQESPDAQIITGLSSLVAAQQIPSRILYRYLKRTGLMDEDEDIKTLQDEAQTGGAEFGTTVPGTE